MIRILGQGTWEKCAMMSRDVADALQRSNNKYLMLTYIWNNVPAIIEKGRTLTVNNIAVFTPGYLKSSSLPEL